jgi:hypothetical protein
LVYRWELMTLSVARGETQFRDDYLNDMDGRHVLEEALNVAPVNERSRFADRVRRADDEIRRYLVATDECIWGAENAKIYGYSRERDWWYYHQPASGLS